MKLLYIESINKPAMLLKHASSLLGKGCRIAAIKAGSSEAGSRAASSHTGAMSSPDVAVDALFRKAGIIRCHGRHELAAVAAVLMKPLPAGRKMAIVTHAGGPAVMMTDALSKEGIDIPPLSGDKADALLGKLFPGSSVANPIDFLATGNAEQLASILDACENDFNEIDAVAVIFGSPGLFPVDDVYDVLHKKMRSGRKAVYPVLPSLITAGREVNDFIARGNINFPDEVVFAHALGKVLNNNTPCMTGARKVPAINTKAVRDVIDKADKGYLVPAEVQKLLDAAGIPRVEEAVAYTQDEAVKIAAQMGFPVVMKVVGPLHKSDVGGVVLNVDTEENAASVFMRLMKKDNVEAVLIQAMISGQELFAGAVREGEFGHLIMAGLGGILIEIMQDVTTCLAPLTEEEAYKMLGELKGYKILEGARGQQGVNVKAFAEVLLYLSALLEVAPEISEIDLNPLMGNKETVKAVDARIRVSDL